MTLGAAYYVETTGAERDAYNWVPESSRRARGFPVWAALRQLGRSGVAEMIGRTLRPRPAVRRGARRTRRASGSSTTSSSTRSWSGSTTRRATIEAGDARTDAVIAAIQADGTLWLGGTRWHGLRAMRISVSGWSTTEADVDASLAVIRRVAEEIRSRLTRSPPRPGARLWNARRSLGRFGLDWHADLNAGRSTRSGSARSGPLGEPASGAGPGGPLERTSGVPPRRVRAEPRSGRPCAVMTATARTRRLHVAHWHGRARRTRPERRIHGHQHRRRA